MIIAGIGHFINPEMYNPFIPDFLPKLAVNYITGIVEIALGIGLLIPAFQKMAAFGIFLLMCAFLPLHIIDVFIENPAIGSKTMAYIRLPIQFVFIAWPLWIWKSKK
ncbi:MAG: hypothetical protein WD048_11250 [Chitinophagales bacterium]